MNYNVIGIMSGTSLDGMDVAYCRLTPNPSPQGEGSSPTLKWKYKILAAKTFPYSKEWKEKLSSVEKKSAEELAQLHSEYGHFIGKIVKKFISAFSPSLSERRLGGEVNFVSSHGHTIFHQPLTALKALSAVKAKIPFTFQLGSGAAIAAECGLPVVCDFRTADVALGGQGAPLVPIGDKLLFSEYDFCLNIGGIANISFQDLTTFKKLSNQRIAYDICPANMVLNFLAKKLGKEFDRNGEIARTGNVNEKLLKELNALKYYSLKPPKSLGKEWVLKEFFPVLEKYKIPVKDKMRTVVEHVSLQISRELGVRSEILRTPILSESSETVKSSKRKVLITGGGAHNKFLIERIRKQLSTINYQLTIPDKLTVDFKEALIFAFLGALRWMGENNCLSSVTGAKKDNCGGAVYLP